MHFDHGFVTDLQNQLTKSQWDAPDLIAARQWDLVTKCATHAWRTVLAQRTRLAAAGWSPDQVLTRDIWGAVTPLTRQDLQVDRAQWLSDTIPVAHGETIEVSTSGATGTPVEVAATAYDAVISKIFDLRALLWHGVNFSSGLAIVRKKNRLAAFGSKGGSWDRWGDHLTFPFETGPLFGMDANRPISEQLRWLSQKGPGYLMTYPSNVQGLAEASGEDGDVRLDLVVTTGECLSEDARPAVDAAFGAKIADIYSSEEAGLIAIQCPDSANYHIQSERVLVEVIKPDGTACAEGEVGRVLVTPLHNFAQPLLRYEIGDLAAPGPERCSCGRGLPTLQRIFGRVRNMMITPNGDQMWPSFGIQAMSRKTPVRQGQFVQIAPAHIEARLVVSHPLTQVDRTEIDGILKKRLPSGMQVSLKIVSELERSASGKFEEFFRAF